MQFQGISSEQAIVILSHFRAIAQVSERKIDAFVSGQGVTESGGMVFLYTRPRKVLNLPARKYFVVEVDGVETRVKFEEGLDLEVRF